MLRHCPRCGEPQAIAVTTKTHATRIGRIEEVEWRCESCFKHFKVHSPIWDVFWVVCAVIFVAGGVAVITGVAETKRDEKTLITLMLLAAGIGAGVYAARQLTTRNKARPVAESNDHPDH